MTTEQTIDAAQFASAGGNCHFDWPRQAAAVMFLMNWSAELKLIRRRRLAGEGKFVTSTQGVELLKGPALIFGTTTALFGALSQSGVEQKPSALAEQFHPNELFCGPVNEHPGSKIGASGICQLLCPK